MKNLQINLAIVKINKFPHISHNLHMRTGNKLPTAVKLQGKMHGRWGFDKVFQILKFLIKINKSHSLNIKSYT